MRPPDDPDLATLEDRLSRGPVDLAPDRAVAWVQGRIRRRVPTAVVRFGEGESRVLAADWQEPESLAVASRKLARQTGQVYGRDDVLRIKSMLMRAFDRADVVGIRGGPLFKAEHAIWIKRIEAIFDARVAAGREPAVVTHCQLNSNLRDALCELLAGRDRVSVVSCRDVGPRLSTRHGVTDVATYQVPSQYIMRDVDEAYEIRMHDTAFWPEFYFDLRASITVRERGEVFLVGAGILGKELCIRIKELGGIALDMGSCLDGMAGRVTRGRHRPEPYQPAAKPRGADRRRRRRP